MQANAFEQISAYVAISFYLCELFMVVLFISSDFILTIMRGILWVLALEYLDLRVPLRVWKIKED